MAASITDDKEFKEYHLAVVACLKSLGVEDAVRQALVLDGKISSALIENSVEEIMQEKTKKWAAMCYACHMYDPMEAAVMIEKSVMMATTFLLSLDNHGDTKH